LLVGDGRNMPAKPYTLYIALSTLVLLCLCSDVGARPTALASWKKDP